MDKTQAIQFFAQISQDFLGTLPPSVRKGFHRDVQEALKVLNQPEQPPKADAP